jgi:hypothetical protein
MPWLSNKQIRTRAAPAPISGKRASHAACATIEHGGVDHGRADVLVTEQFLDSADIVAVFQQLGGSRTGP